MISEVFNRPTPEEELKRLSEEVLQHNGKVSDVTASRYVNNMLYVLSEDEGKKELEKLPLEMRLNLYQAIAGRGWTLDLNLVKVRWNPEHKSRNLDALSISLGLFKDGFEIQQAKSVKSFLSPKNQESLERKWLEDGHYGTFRDAMEQGFQNQLSMGNKKMLMNFITQAYAQHAGLGRVKFDFFDKPADEDGEIVNGCIRRAKDSEKSDFVISMNEQALRNDEFVESLETVMHELEHGRQMKLVDRLEQGEIAESDPEYIAAKSYAITAGKQGHIINGFKNFDAYERQPVEVMARWVGAFASHKMLMEYGKKDDSQLSENKVDFKREAERLLKGMSSL